MAITKKHALSAILLVAALGAGCRRPADADTAPPSRGGEVIASLRSAPSNYNRYFDATAAADLIALLTHARLVQVDRAADTVQPALAESWQQRDPSTFELRLRPDVRFSDGTPLTSADVVFSFEVAYHAAGSRIGQSLLVAGKPLTVTAQDPATVVVQFPAPFAPGVRLLDNLPILPRHKLAAAFKAGTIASAWTPATPLSDVAGLGPFVFAEYVPGQRMIFTRNPHYWRKAQDGGTLPLVDRITVEIVPEQNAEALRLESGATDLMSNADIRPDDYARFKRLADQGRLHLIDVGVALDPNVLWFNLAPGTGKDGKPWLRKKEFRQALSYGVDRQAFANTVYLGAAVPVYGPVTPGNRTWYSPDVPAYPFDPARARRLLAAAGLTDRDGNGMLEDGNGREVRFSMLLQAGHTLRERSGAVLQEQFRQLGVGVDVVGLDAPSMGKRWLGGDYDSVYHGFQSSATDPAMNLDFWLSSGSSHFWNPDQEKPATEWEAKIDDLMARQVAAADLAERQRIFLEVQRVFGEELPALYFVAPRVTAAVAPRLTNLRPAPFIPQLLWSAETIAVTGPRP